MRPMIFAVQLIQSFHWYYEISFNERLKIFIISITAAFEGREQLSSLNLLSINASLWNLIKAWLVIDI